MNQVKPKSAYRGVMPDPASRPLPDTVPDTVPEAAPGTESGTESGKGSGTSARPGLSRADAKLLHGVLIRGDQAVARQRDLVEMHKRFVAMFTTLRVGLDEQQADRVARDREVLVRRLDEMEHALNGMEAVLRIEMAPQLERMLGDALDRRLPAPRPRRFRFAGLVLAVLAGLALGAVYSEQIRQLPGELQAWSGVDLWPR